MTHKNPENYPVVIADDMGNVIRVSENNPEFGFVRLQQSIVEIGRGWANDKSRSALLAGKVETLMKMNLSNNMPIKGKIVVEESLEPFNSIDPDRDLKYAFSGGPLCVYEDQPIYRKTFFTNNLEEEDTFIAHTNGDEIREASAAQRNNNDLVVTQTKTAKTEKKVAAVEEAEEVEEDGNVTFDF